MTNWSFREVVVVKKVNAAEAKAQLSALMAEVAHGGEHVVILRRGKPVAALVRVSDLEYLEQERASSARPRGALALVGAWKNVSARRIDRVVADIYVRRAQDTGRVVELQD